MRVIIAGSRTCEDYDLLKEVIKESGFDITTVVSGAARGVDAMGEMYANEYNIPIARYPADWNKYGKSAGHRRNKVMAENADALIAIHQNKSRGTANMIEEATNLKLKVFVKTL